MNVAMIHKTDGRGGARGVPEDYAVHSRPKLFYIIYHTVYIESP